MDFASHTILNFDIRRIWQGCCESRDIRSSPPNPFIDFDYSAGEATDYCGQQAGQGNSSPVRGHTYFAPASGKAAGSRAVSARANTPAIARVSSAMNIRLRIAAPPDLWCLVMI